MDLLHPQLAAFAAVLEEGSFDAAARRLSVTPSAVSQRIKALEDRLGQALVVRQLPCRPTPAGERLLRRVKREVDPRHFSTLLEQARGPLLFERVKGYDSPAVGNVAGNRRCLTAGLGVGDRELGRRMLQAIEKPIPPVVVPTGPCQEVVYRGDDADLTMFPIPLISTKDGGPYIGGGIVVTKHPEFGRNVGYYRMMYRTPRETNMGVLTHSDMYFNYTRAREEGRPLEVAVAIGVHLTEQLAASYQAPLDVDEFVLVLSGKLVLTEQNGTVQEFTPGQMVVLPRGYTGQWKMEGNYRELAITAARR